MFTAIAMHKCCNSNEFSVGKSPHVLVIPVVAWKSSEVVSLDICRKKIKEFPNELSLCSSHETLVLSYNKIEECLDAV